MRPPPERLWGMSPDLLSALPGYDPDVQKNRGEARQIMRQLDHTSDKRLKVKVTARDLPYLWDPAVILTDQLKEVYIDGDRETFDTVNWLPKVLRRGYAVALSPAGSGPDPDQTLYLNYGCGGELHHNGYCNPEVGALIDG